MSKNIEVQYIRDKGSETTIRGVVVDGQVFVSPYPVVKWKIGQLIRNIPNFKLIVVRDWESDYQDFPTAELFLTPEDFLRFVCNTLGRADDWVVMFFLEYALPQLTKQIKKRG